MKVKTTSRLDPDSFLLMDKIRLQLGEPRLSNAKIIHWALTSYEQQLTAKQANEEETRS